ncbi:DUF4239 domain-containing protein [Granulicella sp. L46]|uniref:bestrophin-like domain n=1 Tax=Granulicella sp. L46 TaxID=1641865 RepID=UPI00131C4A51|nr:DUF4239 domain-containing protein [Granulicella sp. L46]
MEALALSSLVFVLVFGGAFAGMALLHGKPEDRFTPEAKDTIRLAIGLVVTMTGLVLGMLVSSAKTFYDGQTSKVSEMSAQIIFISDLLTAYGPETGQLRIEGHHYIEETVDRIWPISKSQSFELSPGASATHFYQHVEQLAPKNDVQASAKAQLLAAILNLKRTYWLMFLQSEQTSITVPLLSVVTTWLVIIFFSFGIFAPRTPNVVLTLLICALAVSGAIFIILSMNSPFTGVLKISPVAVRDALDQLGTGQ